MKSFQRNFLLCLLASIVVVPSFSGAATVTNATLDYSYSAGNTVENFGSGFSGSPGPRMPVTATLPFVERAGGPTGTSLPQTSVQISAAGLRSSGGPEVIAEALGEEASSNATASITLDWFATITYIGSGTAQRFIPVDLSGFYDLDITAADDQAIRGEVFAGYNFGSGVGTLYDETFGTTAGCFGITGCTVDTNASATRAVNNILATVGSRELSVRQTAEVSLLGIGSIRALADPVITFSNPDDAQNYRIDFSSNLNQAGGPTPIPLPASSWMFLVGLSSLVLIHGRRRCQQL